MTYRVHLLRNDEIHVSPSPVSTLARANYEADKLIERAHSGTLGIGKFQITIDEMAPEGHIERCAVEMEPFFVPARQKETA